MLSLMIRNRILHAVSIAMLLSSFGIADAQENLNPINPVPGATTWRWTS